MFKDYRRSFKRGIFCLWWAMMLIISMLISPFQLIVAVSDAETGTDVTFNGSYGGGSLRQGLMFNDVGTGFWARDSIVRVAAQGLLQGEGDGRFQPGKSLTREEAVTGLIKAMGKEKEALAAAATGGGVQADPWAQGFIAQAKVEKVLDNTQSATLKWTDPVSRQEMAVWLAKALKLTPSYGGDRQSLARFIDAGDIDSQLAPFVDPVVEQKFMAGVSDRKFDPQGELTRAQLAVILDKADPILQSQRGITEHRGVIKSLERAASFDQGYPVNQTKVRADSPDGANWLVLQSPQNSGDGSQVALERSAVVYNPTSRQLGGEELLKEGQEVSYLTDKQNQVFYIEVADPTESSPSEVGKIQEVDPTTGRLVLSKDGGAVSVLPMDKNVAIQVNSKPAVLNDLLFGQEVEAELSDGKVVLIKASMPEPNPGFLPSEQQVHYGRIVEVNSSSLRLSENGQEVEVLISPYTTFARNNQMIQLDQVRPGDMANIYLEDGLTSAAFKPSQITPDPLQAARVVLEGSESLVTNVYKGVLDSYSPVSGEVVLRNSSQYHQASGQYQQANWINEKDLDRLETSSDTQVYLGGHKMSLRDLKRPEYRGQTVFAATKNNYGGQQAVHLSIEPNQTNAFYNQINDINFGESWFSLNDVSLNNQRVVWDDGTLVMHDGRLVSPSYLKSGQDVMVLASYFKNDSTDRGYRASMVIVEQPYFSNNQGDTKYVRFIMGTISDLGLDQINLTDTYEWTKQQRTYQGDLYLKLSQNTQVVDSTDPSSPASLLELDELYAKWGADSAPEQNVFIIAYGDQVLAINLRNGATKPPNTINFRTGKITSIKPNSSSSPKVSIVLDQVKDWVGISEYWEPNSSTSVSVDFDRAQVVRQRQADQPTLLQFKPNDYNRLSVLHKGDQLYWLEAPSGTDAPGNVATPVLVIANPS